MSLRSHQIAEEAQNSYGQEGILTYKHLKLHF
jgi:hypothetical protein